MEGGVLCESSLPGRLVLPRNKRQRTASKEEQRQQLLHALREVRPQLPWIVFNTPRPPTVYSVLASEYHALDVLEDDITGARWCGSTDGGWLVLALNQLQPNFIIYNRSTGARIQLPGLLRSPVNNADLPLDLATVTFSTSPSDGHFVVAAVARVQNEPVAAFWTEGRERWLTAGPALEEMPEDVIYVGQSFRFLMPNEQMHIYRVQPDMDGNVAVQHAVSPVQVRIDFEEDLLNVADGVGHMTHYMAESRGNLLMAVRYVFGAGEGTQVIRMFQLTVHPDDAQQLPSWIELFQLEGRMLFVGPGCSKCYEVAGYEGFADSSIYYLDESAAAFVGLNAEPAHGAAEDPDIPNPDADDEQCPDTGRFTMPADENDPLEIDQHPMAPWPPGRPRSDSPPFWWLP